MGEPSLKTVVRVGVVELSHIEHGHDTPAAGLAVPSMTIANVVTESTAAARRHPITIMPSPFSLEDHPHQLGRARPGMIIERLAFAALSSPVASRSASAGIRTPL